MTNSKKNHITRGRVNISPFLRKICLFSLFFWTSDIFNNCTYSDKLSSKEYHTEKMLEVKSRRVLTQSNNRSIHYPYGYSGYSYSGGNNKNKNKPQNYSIGKNKNENKLHNSPIKVGKNYVCPKDSNLTHHEKWKPQNYDTKDKAEKMNSPYLIKDNIKKETLGSYITRENEKKGSDNYITRENKKKGSDNYITRENKKKNVQTII
ncbi:uncharacterized protein MKS88_000325 [Plasmodium brasilianum]|uniref:uncharacterized protein n=1 Tax=Plasmodium brasilianum TaxID=5824 RepID=UPI00350E412B|nr:hypothetical protein MKS88_000325 [Plasmodium brasilianum]